MRDKEDIQEKKPTKENTLNNSRKNHKNSKNEEIKASTKTLTLTQTKTKTKTKKKKENKVNGKSGINSSELLLEQSRGNKMFMPCILFGQE